MLRTPSCSRYIDLHLLPFLGDFSVNFFLMVKYVAIAVIVQADRLAFQYAGNSGLAYYFILTWLSCHIFAV